ncbi:MAG: hypothetical protein H6R10_89 [Rhodocyclaceae bacterium]|nr:hypothetical protein [Rhodocyclaceae bacterium]
MNIRKLLNAGILALCGLFAATAQSAFDPVHEDIDIFMTNPSITSQRPNILIVLDTTANWGSYFASEKSALISVIGGLTENYNVGLMLFTGGSIQGAYLRYAIRQMTNTNKSALQGLVNELSDGSSASFTGDKTNNAAIGQAMNEAYRYFKGEPSYSASTQSQHDPRTDYGGNANNSWITSLAGNAFTSTPAVNTPYNSPVTNACQKNFIIYISNGKVSNQSDETTSAKTQLDTAYGATYPTITPLSPSGIEDKSWFDEWAKFMVNTGFQKSINGVTKTITASTYVVEINPGIQSADRQFTAMLVSGSLTNGKGNYFATTGGDPAAQLTEALTNIFTEIQAVNSVFASTTLPVSVNVRGTNLNQVYIGMFRPDADKTPRWFGNLKMYKLGMGANNQLQLVDANANKAESTTTGFVTDTAKSFWTSESSFWSYRSSEVNGAGGDSDSPDGSLVEKGGVAQRLRASYAAGQASRKLYTCIGSSCQACTATDAASGDATEKTCSGGSALSATLFSTDNTDITATSLGLGTKAVASLTAKVTRPVSAISDRRNVSLSNATGLAVAVSALNNGATLKTVTAATAFDATKQMSTTALTGLASSMSPTTVAGKSSSGSSVTLSISTTGFNSNPCAGKDYVTVAGNDPSVNGTWPIVTTSTSPSRYAVTFTVSGTASPDNNGTLSCAAKSTVATATVNTLPAGLAAGSRINISGAQPAAFNGNFTVNSVSAANKTFTYTLDSTQGPATTQGTLKVVNTVSGDTYSAATTTARITVTAASHGFQAGDSLVLTGITPSTYNGSVTVRTATTNSFTYDLSFGAGSPPPDATAFGYAYKGATTIVTVTLASGALYQSSPIDITGTGSPCFDKTGAAATWISATQFSYTTGTACQPLANIPAGAQVNASGYSKTVTATLPGHGFSIGNNITIADGTEAWHRGEFIVTAADANTFTYNNNNVGSEVAPTGQYTVRLTTTPRAYVTAAAHGFATGDSIIIAGVTPTSYNNTWTITRIDDDHFSFILSSAPGIGTGTITASKNTTTAWAYSVNHSFSEGASVTIAGATPTAFNGAKTIHVVDSNNFTYSLDSAQGDAAGTIVAASGTGSNSERDSLINWVRGQDNALSPGGENADGSMTDCRASVHGDVLHSRPAVINYNRYGGENDVYIFYGANDGVFHAVKGGTAKDATDPGTLNPGEEAWGFIPSEGFTFLQRLRNNSPKVAPNYKKPYFMDGPIGVLTIDGNKDGQENSATESDKVYLYVGARRGGRFIYSLDVTNPTSPKYRWKIDNQTTGFGELGQTWSLPTVVTSINGYKNPVLIFGGGYDPLVEDAENCTIQSASASEVQYYTGPIKYTTTGCTKSDDSAIGATDTPNTTATRSMGRAIYMVDAITGELIWSASGSTTNGTPNLQVAGMDFAIAADPLVVRNESGGKTNRAYFADTGGNVWRFDFGNSNKANWTITKIAAVGNVASASGRRKFLYPPDVVGAAGYDAVLIGSGDREHPFDMSVTNRFYMLKDKGNDNGPLTGVDNTPDSTDPTITEARLYNATTTSQTTASTTATQADKTTATTTATAAIQDQDGWYVTLAAGEKDIGNAVALNGVVFFNTNVSPMSPSVTDSSSCESNLGIAKQYQVGIADVATTVDNHVGGGYLPSPVHVVVTVDVTSTDPVTGVQSTTQKTVEGVVSGTEVQTPGGVILGTRSRRFWYKEID